MLLYPDKLRDATQTCHDSTHRFAASRPAVQARTYDPKFTIVLLAPELRKMGAALWVLGEGTVCCGPVWELDQLNLFHRFFRRCSSSLSDLI